MSTKRASATTQRRKRVPQPTTPDLPNIYPRTAIAKLDRGKYKDREETFPVEDVAPVVGMAESFIRRIHGNKKKLTVDDVLELLDQDAFAETFVPRSRVLDYLLSELHTAERTAEFPDDRKWQLVNGDFLQVVGTLPKASVQCVVTSTPYWGMRIYKDSRMVKWADGEECAFGHEQTPEGFIRHTVEVLHRLRPVLTDSASIWWNLMDTYMTRTQIRGNAYEALQAMDGRNRKKWGDHEHHRYSAGHSYIKDGEQCGIPALVAERASRIGYFTKSIITWAKIISLPEPQNSRVSRSLEYVLHLSTQRAAKFDKSAYRRLDASLGGRNALYEGDKLSDVWVLPVSSGGGGHGAQFPSALPGRCISIATDPGDVVLDPFVGSGNTAIAALTLGRRIIGVDVSQQYLDVAETKIRELEERLPIDIAFPPVDEPEPVQRRKTS
ncbi:DNA-methyltransferase [Mycobacteroides chelonae]|uniref:DNA-methyltransferase n=1 Tax=Mycobacteroides chelonae TaxID=1774 RepID=UPI0018B01F5F|nr:site-specific DNA-methyltransferase [Mycobacteroides chelonae]MBF9519556.1 site-specific DNA-methyltransferase [Mycobacteroides chelonae]